MANGSTAPAIASPLLAWPSRPSPRFTNSSSPTSPPAPTASSASSSSTQAIPPPQFPYASNNQTTIGLGLRSTASSAISTSPSSSAACSSSSPYLHAQAQHLRYAARSASASVAESSARARVIGSGSSQGEMTDGNGDQYHHGGTTGGGGAFSLGEASQVKADTDDSNRQASSSQQPKQRRDYAPPCRPLSPHQLSRIAQSFGIVIPTLPVPSPSPSSSPILRSSSPISFASRVRTRSATPSSSLSISHHNHHHHHHHHLSHFLLSVIPPATLLPPSPLPDQESTSGIASRVDPDAGRVKRWRRGRLLQLQPTLAAMLVSIAREFGLPSTLGVGVYLVQSSPSLNSIHRDSLSSEMGGLGTDPLSDPSGLGTEPEGGMGTGPMISASTWSTLFAAYIHTTPSMISTPATTPNRNQRGGSTGPQSSNTSTNGAPPPLSPLSLVLEQQTLNTATAKPDRTNRRPLSFSADPTPVKAPSHSSLSSFASSHLPITPISSVHNHHMPQTSSPSGSSLAPTISTHGGGVPGLGTPSLPIVGTIEFDIDLIEATWFDEWQRNGGTLRRRTGSQVLDNSGMRELKLVGRLASDDRPKFLREIDTQRANVTLPDSDSYAALASDEDEEDEEEVRRGSIVEITVPDDDEDPLGDVFPSPAAEFAALRASRPNLEHRLSIKDIGTDRALSASASMSVFDDDDESGLTERGSNGQDDIDEIKRIIRERDDLLASPIDLGAGMNDVRLIGPSRLSVGLQEIDKRASGLVMADRLENLEKIMRDLSPREIRLTSPRQLTPRTALKIGINTNPASYPSAPTSSSSASVSQQVQIPSRPVKSSKPPSSPLAGNFIGPDGLPAPFAAAFPQPAPNASGRGAPVWPAIPFAHLTDSPGSPSSISEYFRKDANPSPSGSTLSNETIQRMQSEAAAAVAAAQPRTLASEWKPPRRPTRENKVISLEESDKKLDPQSQQQQSCQANALSGHATALPPPPRMNRSSSASSSPTWATAGAANDTNEITYNNQSVTPTLPVVEGHDRPSPAMSNASDDATPGGFKRRTRSGSVSFKSLRSRNSKSNLKRDKEKAPDVPALPTNVSVTRMTPSNVVVMSPQHQQHQVLPTQRHPHEPIGLFRGASVEAATRSSFTGLRADEFGQVAVEGDVEQPKPLTNSSTSSSLPSSGKNKDGPGFASRFFSFGARRKDAGIGSHHPPPEIKPPPSGDHVQSHNNAKSGSRSSKRTPSESGAGSPGIGVGLPGSSTISPPLSGVKNEIGLPLSASKTNIRSPSAASIQFYPQQHPNHGSRSASVDYAQSSPASPGSQSSPRTVRRKPVPDFNGENGRMVSESPSIGSMSSILGQRHAQ